MILNKALEMTPDELFLDEQGKIYLKTLSREGKASS